MSDVALIAPPSWYYSAVPADLSWPAGHLRAHGIDTLVRDLSAEVLHDVLGATEPWLALRDPQAYQDPEIGMRAARDLFAVSREISERFRVHCGPRGLSFPDADGTDIRRSLAVGLDSSRNPALPTLERAAEELVAARPRVMALTMVHPEQRVGAVVLAHLLREAGFTGRLVLYGSLEDVLAPMDLAPDLLGTPGHALFQWFDGVVIGEAESALLALARDESVVPNLLREDRAAEPHRESLDSLASPSFAGFDRGLYPYPEPLVDLRLGRGCPWGRCRFCAIQAHQPGYRSTEVAKVVRDMAAAHRELGTRWFRLRDDLLTPTQLAELGSATSGLDFAPRWTARARFSPQLSRSVLEAAAAGGLDELWLGLESAVPRVRESMDKGVRQDVVLRVLADCEATGVRVRALCLLGFPGETEAEARQTVDFLVHHAHQLSSAALTPFQLMRNSPMARGIHPSNHPVPRHHRLEHGVNVDLPSALPTPRVRHLIAEAGRRLMPKMHDPWGPSLEHGWMRARWE